MAPSLFSSTSALFRLFIAFLALCSSEVIVREHDDDDHPKSSKRKPQMFNFAAQAAGAVLLDRSPASKGYQNLLNDDKDKYGISPCDEKKWVVIGLSEEVQITSVELLNFEKYSSMLRDFQLLASSSYPTDEWINLGTYTAQPQLGSQTFQIHDLSEAHTRYLKVKFLTHYSNEALCTLSQIKVFGTTVIAAFQQEVERSDSSMRDMLNQLNSEDAVPDYAALLNDSAEPDGPVAAAVEPTAVGEGSAGSPEPASQVEPPSSDLSQNQQQQEVVEAAVSSEPSWIGPQPGAIGEISAFEATAESEEAANRATAVEEAGSAASEHGTPASSEESHSHCTAPTMLTAAESPDISNDPQAEVRNTQGQPDSTGNVAGQFAPFNLAGKVKQLLPGLFSALEAGDSEDRLLEVRAVYAGEEEGAGEDREDTAAGAPSNSADMEGVVPLEVVDREPVISNTSFPLSIEAGREATESYQQVLPSARDEYVGGDGPLVPLVHGHSGGSGEDVEGHGEVASASPSLSVVANASQAAAAVQGAECRPEEGCPTAISYSEVGASGSRRNDSGSGGGSSGDRDGTESHPAPAAAGGSPPSAGSPTTARIESVRVVSVGPARGAAGGVLVNVTAPLSGGGSMATGNASSFNSGTGTSNGSTAAVPNLTLSCIEALSFPEFSRKMRAKLQQFGAGNSSTSAGGANSTGALGAGEEGPQQQQQQKEARDKDKESNVFKSLMQKIKTLEMNNAIMEMYTIQLSECYRTVSKELLQRTQEGPSVRTKRHRAANKTITGDSSEGTVSLHELLSVAGTILSGSSLARDEGLTRVFAEMVWEFAEQHMAAVLAALVLAVAAALLTSIGVCWLLVKHLEGNQRKKWA